MWTGTGRTTSPTVWSPPTTSSVASTDPLPFSPAAPPIAREVFEICHVRNAPYLIPSWVIDLLTEELGFPPTYPLTPLPSSESATTAPEPIGSVAEEEEDAEGGAPAGSESSDDDYVDEEPALSADNEPLDADMADASFEDPTGQPAARSLSVATTVPKAPQEAPVSAPPLQDATATAPDRSVSPIFQDPGFARVRHRPRRLPAFIEARSASPFAPSRKTSPSC